MDPQTEREEKEQTPRQEAPNQTEKANNETGEHNAEQQPQEPDQKTTTLQKARSFVQTHDFEITDGKTKSTRPTFIQIIYFLAVEALTEEKLKTGKLQFIHSEDDVYIVASVL